MRSVASHLGLSTRSTNKSFQICRTFATTAPTSFAPSRILHRLRPYDETHEEGLSFRDEPLNDRELFTVFGFSHPGPYLSNRLLKVLHARRVDGTLDIPLDEELSLMPSDYPDAERAALDWLRAKYPVDEDQAILDRFKREDHPREQEHPSALMERGQRLGLFKTQDASQVVKEEKDSDSDYYGPQSGQYYASLAEKNEDVFGRSELERIRAANEAAAEEEERQMQERIDRSMEEAEVKAREKSQALAERPEQGVEVSEGGKIIRPPNEFEKWVIRARERASTKLTLESPEIANMTSAQRILPSLVFVLACCGGLYLLTEYWEPPRRSERIMPDTSLAMATCIGILGLNVAVFLAWKFPPALRMLNNYFIVIPAYPRMFSMLGNVFSQHAFRHLLMNMAGLFIFGPALHEDVGRANFIAIYLASGLLGSLVSLSSYVLRGILVSSSLGASGSIWGITAAYMWLHRDDNFSLIFIPSEYKEQFRAKGWLFLAGFVIIDAFVGVRKKTIDVAAHWTGMMTGVITSALWEANGNRPDSRNRPAGAEALLNDIRGQK
ncbi:hypothetical protein OHC33_007017 [Knufia fluminis]|uniref:Peptidase S54 rhomboid domain-containing protein n=1 Tax=Knufia fluminis TaxID=191047 RepID=A0AAN8I720_9EURO|nr:hypothetical protein OHC33_007017 [Knufia fluminis]